MSFSSIFGIVKGELKILRSSEVNFKRYLLATYFLNKYCR